MTDSISKLGVIWLNLGGAIGRHRLEDRIESGRSFHRVLEVKNVRSRTVDLAIISFNSYSVDALCLVRHGREVAVGQFDCEFFDFVHLGYLSLQKVRESLGNRFKRYLPKNAPHDLRLSKSFSAELLKTILVLAPDHADAIQRLTRSLERKPFKWKRNAPEDLIFEKDAFNLAAEIFDRRDARLKVVQAANQNSPNSTFFLDNIQSLNAIEDRLIDFDTRRFPGFQLIKESAAGFVELRSRDRRLFAMNSNRSVERALGVDLIYINTYTDSFVMVQYKRMASFVDGNCVFRPSADARLDVELQTMTRISAELQQHPASSHVDFRLSSNPFLIKLCESRIDDLYDPNLLPGMYIPLELWPHVITSEDVVGPQGGIGIGWHNCPRYMTNSEFSRLVRDGWLGTVSGASRVVEDIIQNELKAEKRVVAAFEDRPYDPPLEYLRDHFGKFTTEDDPTAEYF